MNGKIRISLTCLRKEDFPHGWVMVTGGTDIGSG